MTHPLHAPDDVGRICGEMGPWALDFATSILTAGSGRHDRAERAEALRKVFEYWPKLCRRMAELEAVAPASFQAGSARDLSMMDVVEGINSSRDHARTSGSALEGSDLG